MNSFFGNSRHHRLAPEPGGRLPSELGMLCVYWSLLYARQPANSFAFAKYDPQAVKDKLRKLRGRL